MSIYVLLESGELAVEFLLATFDRVDSMGSADNFIFDGPILDYMSTWFYSNILY
jgi:hypothetical protein